MENPVKAAGFIRNILTYPEYCKALTRGIKLSLVHFPPCAGISSVTLCLHLQYMRNGLQEQYAKSTRKVPPAFNPYR